MHDGDVIRIVGAREHNLQGIDLEIPKRALTVVTGVSGSGKSSLVFSTIAAEAQRLINETYPAFVQGFMPALARPDVDRLEGLTPAIVVDQERMGGNPRSTVGTATDANALLRILFSRLGEPSAGPAMAYSFNVASVSARGAITVDRAGAKTQRVTFDRRGGMCPRCEGMGQVTTLDLAELFDGRVPVRVSTTIEDAVHEAYALARPGGTVLLAPACASFDEFSNYAERGRRFCALVAALAEEGSGGDRRA